MLDRIQSYFFAGLSSVSSSRYSNVEYMREK
jgi:hypothetical protein